MHALIPFFHDLSQGGWGAKCIVGQLSAYFTILKIQGWGVGVRGHLHERNPASDQSLLIGENGLMNILLI